jgi:hypothetical protein
MSEQARQLVFGTAFEIACVVFMRENKEYMWTEYCVALMIAALRINPMHVPNEVVTAAGLIATSDDEPAKFFMFIDEVVLSSDAFNIYSSLQ